MDFISNNNKAMIWGLLQDSNIFEGIGNEKYNLIQKTFEETIHEIHRSGTNIPLLEKNKMAMNELITKINKERNNNRPNNSNINSNNNHSEKPLEMIYTASDLQNQRANEMSLKLKEQQDSMNTLMNPSKPKDVNFSDTSLADDKPIGEEMDKLIAERMASRERELEVPPITKETEQWLNTNKDTASTTNSTSISIHREPMPEKRVSFDSTTPMDNMLPKTVTNTPDINTNTSTNTSNNNTNTSNNSIFSKLKRKTDNIVTDNSNIVDELKIIKETQEQLKNTCNQILEILQNKNIA